MAAVGYTGGDPNKLDATGYAQGDIPAADAAGTLQPVPIGTPGNVLTVDAGQPELLDYQAGGGGGGGVTSVFARTGNVVAQSGDYTKAQVGLGNVANSLQLVAASNLSDLTNVVTARTNLGLGTAAVQPASAFDAAGAAAAARVKKINTGAVTTGTVTATNGLPFTQVFADLTIAAAVGDILGYKIEALLNNSGDTIIFDAATRSAVPADVNYFTSGTGTPLFNGGRPGWYHVLYGAGFFQPVSAEVEYTVKAGDIVGGNVTVRGYAAADTGGGSGRGVFGSAAIPRRATLTNYGPG